MLFLGLLDDKTKEFPFGEQTDLPPTTLDILLSNIVFNEKILLIEEGFILASDEAIKPGEPKLLLSAIKHGLIKVATRYKDMKEYTLERRKNKHPAPPNTNEGNDYVAALQVACEKSNAFVDYPPEKIDEITYSRFVETLEQSHTHEILHFCEHDLPATFIDTYEKTYLYGNEGKQWTARSAWEQTLNLEFSHAPEIINSFMAIANRERQILRAASISKVNKIDMYVETGLEKSEHDLLLPAGISTQKYNAEESLEIYPRVSTNELIKGFDKVFSAFGNKRSALCKYRSLYLDFLEDKQHHDTSDIASAARQYEDEIYSVLGKKPAEKNLIGNIAGTAAIGAVTSASVAAALGALKNRKERPLFNDVQKKLYTKRQFVKFVSVGIVVGGASVIDNRSGVFVESGVKNLRTKFNDDLADSYVRVLSQGSSLQTRRIDPESLGLLTF